MRIHSVTSPLSPVCCVHPSGHIISLFKNKKNDFPLLSGEARARWVVPSGKAPLFSSTLPPTSSRLTGTDGAHSKVCTAGQPQLPLDFSHSQRAADGRWKYHRMSVKARVMALIYVVWIHVLEYELKKVCTAAGYCFIFVNCLTN